MIKDGGILSSFSGESLRCSLPIDLQACCHDCFQLWRLDLLQHCTSQALLPKEGSLMEEQSKHLVERFRLELLGDWQGKFGQIGEKKLL